MLTGKKRQFEGSSPVSKLARIERNRYCLLIIEREKVSTSTVELVCDGQDNVNFVSLTSTLIEPGHNTYDAFIALKPENDAKIVITTRKFFGLRNNIVEIPVESSAFVINYNVKEDDTLLADMVKRLFAAYVACIDANFPGDVNDRLFMLREACREIVDKAVQKVDDTEPNFYRTVEFFKIFSFPNDVKSVRTNPSNELDLLLLQHISVLYFTRYYSHNNDSDMNAISDLSGFADSLDSLLQHPDICTKCGFTYHEINTLLQQRLIVNGALPTANQKPIIELVARYHHFVSKNDQYQLLYLPNETQDFTRVLLESKPTITRLTSASQGPNAELVNRLLNAILRKLITLFCPSSPDSIRLLCETYPEILLHFTNEVFDKWFSDPNAQLAPLLDLCVPHDGPPNRQAGKIILCKAAERGRMTAEDYRSFYQTLLMRMQFLPNSPDLNEIEDTIRKHPVFPCV